MKKLKIILLFSLILYIYIIITNNIYKRELNLNEKQFVGKIIYMNVSDDKVSLIIKGKQKVLVNYYSNNYDKNLKLGDTVSIIGKLKYPNDNTWFNLFNYRKYLLSIKISYILSADSIKLIKENKSIFYFMKNKIISKISHLNSSKYLKTFILGDKSELTDDIKNIYQENGISHLLAISGMHISLLACCLLVILKKVKYNHLIISIFLLFYTFLIDFTPSVIRAVAFFILGNLKIKKSDLLIIIASVLLLYNPYYIYNVGFIFSFTISLFLILFGSISNKYNNYFIKLFITSFICFLASIPILINNFFYINIMSPLLNIIFVPYVSLIVFPISLLVVICPFLDNLLLLLSNILEYLSIWSNCLNINIILCKVPFIIIAFYYFVIILSLNNKKFLVILFILLVIHSNIRMFKTANNLTMLDVGQGDSSLLEIKDGAVLIDTGGIVSYNGNNYSIALNKTIPYLKSLGIKRLDLLIITHGDYDHIGEAINLINNFKVKRVLLNSGTNNELENNLIELLDNKKILYENISQKAIYYKGIKFQFLNDIDKTNENEDSLILFTNISNKNIIFMGDAGKASEKFLINAYNLEKMDILKVGHHGSKNSSYNLFIEKIKPQIALISAGLNNKFGHPHKEVLDILQANNVLPYITSIDGSIKINLDKFKIYTCNGYANAS